MNKDKLIQVIAKDLEELKTLKMYVYALEEQNETLRTALLEQKTSSKLAFEKLQDIYRDGIHVCPSHFAQLREGDCLFCLDFLRKEGQGRK